MSVGTSLGFAGRFFFLLLIPEDKDIHSAKLGESWAGLCLSTGRPCQGTEETVLPDRTTRLGLSCLWVSFDLHRSRCWESDSW